jgi:hypothetical protein
MKPTNEEIDAAIAEEAAMRQLSETLRKETNGSPKVKAPRRRGKTRWLSRKPIVSSLEEVWLKSVKG